MSLHDLQQYYGRRVEISLASYLPEETLIPQRLHQAMRYAVMGGGKRIRPLLVYLAGTAVHAKEQALDAPACAVELIHAYSLIHDDLPAMDNDPLRRGKPTCHIAFDEASAILAGDALQPLAFQILAEAEALHAEQRLAMIATLAKACGSRGMVGGQAIDIAAVGQAMNLVELENMHIHKTGALIHASVKMGVLAAAQVSTVNSEALEHYARCVGLAFQIQDDILDETTDTMTLGKAQGADRSHDKPTYPALVGLSKAKDMAQALVEDAINRLANFDERADPLRVLARYIQERQY